MSACPSRAVTAAGYQTRRCQLLCRRGSPFGLVKSRVSPPIGRSRWWPGRHTRVVKVAQRAVVVSLEVACRATRFVEWVPGWTRVYWCLLARSSNRLDKRWETGVWPQHDWAEWEAWWESLTPEEHENGHWHAW